MHLDCRIDASVGSRDLQDYVRDVTIGIQTFDADCAHRYTVGKLALNQVLWADAIADRISLFEICDNDSQGLHEMHVILTKGTNALRNDLRIRGPVDCVLFGYKAIFHPVIRAHRQAIIDTALRLFGMNALAVMWKETSQLTEQELADLGFRKIAGEELIYRYSRWRTPYAKRFPHGETFDVDGLQEHHKWVTREWAKFRHGIEDEP